MQTQNTNFILTIIIPSISLIFGLCIIFFIGFSLLKKSWVNDNKILRTLGMKCNTDHDIQFSSSKIWEIIFIQVTLFFGLFMTIANIISCISTTYFTNGSSFYGTSSLWIILSVILPLIYYIILVFIVFYFKNKYTNPTKINDLAKFLKGYKPVDDKHKFDVEKLPWRIRNKIKRINTKNDFIIRALLIATRYYGTNPTNEKLIDAVSLFNHLLINK